MSSSFRNRIIPVLFLLLALTVTVPLSSYVATIIVEPGDDLTQKIGDASAGDTISVKPGTYSGAKTNGFVINKSLTLKASDPDKPPTLTVPSGSSINIGISSDNVTVDGFTVTGGFFGIGAKGGGVLSGLNIKNLTITTDTGGDGHGISFDGVENSVIDSNVVTNAHDNGIYITNSSSVLVMNNTVQSTIIQHGIGITFSDNIVVVDNKITGSGFHGILLVETTSSRVERNTVSGHTIDGIDLTDSSNFNYVGHNHVPAPGVALGSTIGTGIWLNSESNGNLVYANDTSGSPENGLSI